jgi:hypothetical protein
MSWVTRLSSIAALLCISIGWLHAEPQAAGAMRYPVNVPPQELALALQVLAKDRDFQVVYRSELVSHRRTGGASGLLTLDEALTQLLFGTGLMYRYLDHNAITIIPSE